MTLYELREVLDPDGSLSDALEDLIDNGALAEIDPVAYLTEQGAEVVDTYDVTPDGTEIVTGQKLVFRLPVLADSTQPPEETT